jgi:hypothetical protein
MGDYLDGFYRGREEGEITERERIIKLLIEEGILKPRTNENENDQQIIALIKGETK